MSLTICGLTHSPDFARQLVSVLRGKGVPAGRIAMIFPEPDVAEHSGARPLAVRVRRPPGSGLFSGVFGWTSGLTLAGWVSGLVVVLLPDIATALATAPLLWTSAASTLGGITGAIVGLAVAELEASRYNDQVRDRGVVISVRTADNREVAEVDRLFADRACESLAHIEDPAETVAERADRHPALVS